MMTHPSRKCVYCGKSFVPKRPWQKYCQGTCRWEAWDQANPRVKVKQPHEAEAKAQLKGA